jgi:RNA polymerase sigma-B factor
MLVAPHRQFERDPERLVRRHLPLVRSLASRHTGRGESLDDLVQVASLALITAARRFDPDRGVPFAAYAAPTIDGELRHHLRDCTGAVRIPRREQQTAVRISEALGAVSQRLGREASLPEAADAASVAVGDARRALETRCPPTPWTELESCASVAADEEIDACELRALVQAGLRHLDTREREAVRLRFVADLQQTEIGRRMGISQSQASRILASALEKLRRELGPELEQAA